MVEAVVVAEYLVVGRRARQLYRLAPGVEDCGRALQVFALVVEQHEGVIAQVAELVTDKEVDLPPHRLTPSLASVTLIW